MSAPSERDYNRAITLATLSCRDFPEGKDAIAQQLATARAEGYRAGCEAAAEECEVMPMFTEREKACAAAIRALAEKGEQG